MVGILDFGSFSTEVSGLGNSKLFLDAPFLLDCGDLGEFAALLLGDFEC